MAEMLIALFLIGIIIILLILGLKHNDIKPTLNKVHYDKAFTELVDASKAILSFDKTLSGTFPPNITSDQLKEKFQNQFNVSDADVQLVPDEKIANLLH